MAFEFKVDKEAPLIPTAEEYKSVLQLVERAYMEQITLFNEDLYTKGYGDGYRAAKAEIVHCGGCKYGELDDGVSENVYHCRHHGNAWYDGGHFCSYGERRGSDG